MNPNRVEIYTTEVDGRFTELGIRAEKMTPEIETIVKDIFATRCEYEFVYDWWIAARKFNSFDVEQMAGELLQKLKAIGLEVSRKQNIVDSFCHKLSSSTPHRYVERGNYEFIWCQSKSRP